MPTDTGGEAGDASQNEPTNVAVTPPNAAQRPPREPSARERLVEAMESRILESREADNQRALESGDPRAIQLAAEMGREARGEPISTDAPRVARPAPESGTVQRMDQDDDAAGAEARAATQVRGDGSDPLAEYIVRGEAGPMFRAVVDGREVLMPLDRARAQLQKHVAADIRLQQAADARRQLEERARHLDAVERDLQQRAAAPAVAQIDDAALETEAAEVVRSLVSEPEQAAAQKLAKVLKTVRQAATPRIDPDAIASRAASIAEQRVVERDTNRALTDGLKKFTEAYPDIAADSDLYALADRRTTAIAKDNPGWTPEQVMLEAGRQVREKFGRPGLRPVPNAGQSGDAARMAAKAKLTPMPVTRTARTAPGAEQEPDNSPQGALAEIRKARGQAY